MTVQRPRETFLAAEELAARGDFEGAAALYRVALASHRTPPPRWSARAAQSFARSGDLDAAIAALHDAVEDPAPPARWLERLARLQARRGDEAASAATWARYLDASPETRDLHRRLLARDARDFADRRRVADFLEPRIVEVRERAAVSLDAGEGRDPVFTLWFQGFADAPPAVRACRRQLDRATRREVIALDDTTLRGHVRLPDHLDRLDLKPAHRSDLLRLELLGRYGGTWLDATVFVRDDVDEALAAVSSSGFFAFDQRGSTLSNWLLSTGGPDNHLVRMLRAALHCWWESAPAKSPYYVFHHVFAVLLELDDDVRAIWDRTPSLSSGPPHRLARHLASPYDAERFEALFSAAFAHKLTYKRDGAAADAPTMLRHLLER